MKTRLYFIVPGPLSTRTGGYIYDRRMIEGLRALGQKIDVVELSGAYPFPFAADIARANAAFAAIPNNSLVVIDGLALGALPDIAERHAHRLDLVALVHHPLADETGLSNDHRDALMRSETRALTHAPHVIVTSAFTRRRLAACNVPPERISVCVPGVDAAALARGSGSDTLVLLCPASLTPRKGHADLFAALADLLHLNWRLICAGNPTLDPAHAVSLTRMIARLGLETRIEMRGEASETEMHALYAGADLFVLASHYEGYGMVVTEAVARGLPIVTTSGGALVDTVPRAAALIVPPGDVAGLRDALRLVISDSALRVKLAEGSREARAHLADWNRAAETFARALKGARP